MSNNVTTSPASPSEPDPFDPESLRIVGDPAQAAGVKKTLLTIPIRKPDKTWFVQTHPDPAYRLETYVLDLKDDREIYLVDRNLVPALATESTLCLRALYTAITRQGTLFIWPVKLAGADGKLDNWSRSAQQAAALASTGWVRVTSNMSLGAYEVFQPTGVIPEPEWPDKPFKDLLRIAFCDYYIDSLQHPVLRRLKGEI